MDRGVSVMAIIDDFKALSDALGRLQGKVPRRCDEPTNANLPCTQAPVPPGGQMPTSPRFCSYCKGYGHIMHPKPDGSLKPYPCPQCNGAEEVKF
jgi:hypothetical protein